MRITVLCTAADALLIRKRQQHRLSGIYPQGKEKAFTDAGTVRVEASCCQGGGNGQSSESPAGFMYQLTINANQLNLGHLKMLFPYRSPSMAERLMPELIQQSMLWPRLE